MESHCGTWGPFLAWSVQPTFQDGSQLDEAHNIKERSTNTAKAAFELNSKYKWCLSGTPLQNRVGELYSLVRFLGGDPFSYYFCKSAADPFAEPIAKSLI